MFKKVMIGMLCIGVACTAEAKITIQMSSLIGPNAGQSIGTITAENTAHGLLLTPDLTSLSPGIHGFHLHENANCGDAGMAAGDHYDPMKSKSHRGPYTNQGHEGDLPALYANNEGKVTTPVLAPRLSEKDLVGHSLIIHAGGDNYSDNPKLGGGGTRIACGLIK